MPMRRGVAVAVSLIGVFLQVLLLTEAARGQENNPEVFSFIQHAKLLEGTPVAEDQFGSGVALDGDTALIGVPGDDEKGSFAGAVRVFQRNDDGVWQETQKLTADNGAANNFFGASVAVSGKVAFVGARGANPKGNFSGSVYVFEQGDDGVWRQVQILTAEDGTAGNFFGWSVAVHEDTALIGARGNGDDPNFPGAAYVFVRGDAEWTQQQKLTASDEVGGIEFGYSVALLDGAALIGARATNEKGILTGAAYLFSRNADGQWTQQQKLTASDSASGDEFGYSVALSANSVIVGARFARDDSEDPETITHPGAVYVYELAEPDGVRWEEAQKLLASDGTDGSEFGGSIAVSGDALLIGARRAISSGSITGAAYLFTREQEGETPASWKEHQRILARDGASGDAFASSIALSGEVAVIGSPFDDFSEADTGDVDKDGDTEEILSFIDLGAAYLFTMTSFPATCTAKTDYGDFECSKTFLVASLADLDEYLATDFGRANNNGRYANLDIIASLNASFLEIQSPCEITLDPGVTLSGDFVKIDGRKGVSGRRPRIVETKKVCVISEQGNVSPGDDAIIEVGELTLQAGEGAIIGDDAVVTVDGALTIKAVGDESRDAVIDSGAVVSAGSLLIEGPRAAQIREKARLTVDGALSMVSTTDGSGSEVIVEEDVQIQATDLTMSSPRKAQIDEGVSIRLSGAGELVGGSEAVVNKNVTINVTGDFHMEAADAGRCKISSSAQISAGTTSGNCF